MAEPGDRGRGKRRGPRRIEGYEGFGSSEEDPELRGRGLGEWRAIDLGEQFADAPFTLHVAKFKSSTRESEEFIHLPLEVMIRAGVPGVTESSRIVTLVTHHERSLARWPMFAMATVHDDGSVDLMLHKVEAPD